MQTNNINIYHQNNTTFGTNFGPNLTRYIEQGKSKLTEVQKKNINMIKNNGFNTTLDVVQEDFHHEIFEHKGEIVDKKDSILGNLHSDFFCKCKLIPDFIRENSMFYMFKINNNSNKLQQILNHFNTDYLNKIICEDMKLAERVTNEYDKFMKSKFS